MKIGLQSRLVNFRFRKSDENSWCSKINHFGSGAIGKHGSIAVNERVIKTLKFEWLKRVMIIKGYDHIEILCNTFVEWYNEWRSHYRLDGNTPEDVFAKHQTETLDQNAKTIPFSIK